MSTEYRKTSAQSGYVMSRHRRPVQPYSSERVVNWVNASLRPEEFPVKIKADKFIMISKKTYEAVFKTLARLEDATGLQSKSSGSMPTQQSAVVLHGNQMMVKEKEPSSSCVKKNFDGNYGNSQSSPRHSDEVYERDTASHYSTESRDQQSLRVDSQYDVVLIDSDIIDLERWTLLLNGDGQRPKWYHILWILPLVLVGRCLNELASCVLSLLELVIRFKRWVFSLKE